ITGSNAGVPGYYYFFYNWVVQTAPCITVRNTVPVTVTFQNQSAFSYTNVANTYNFTSSATMATQWWWNFGDGSPVATTQNPVHTYLTPSGPYTVQLVVSDGICFDTSAQIINVISGINELSGSISNIYPNPASNELYISGQVVSTNFTAEIYDMLGQKVYSIKPEIRNSKYEIKIYIYSLHPGVYDIEIIYGDNRSSGRFVKQK